MRSLALFTAALIAFHSPASAEEHGQTTFVTLELQAIETEPDINGTVVRMLRGPFGIYSFFYVDRQYAEALVGPLFALNESLVIGVGAGIEQWPTGSWRVGGMIAFGGYESRLVSTTFVETGASGFWARTEFAWRPSVFCPGPDDPDLERCIIGVGLLADTLIGAGPRVEINTPKLPLQVWAAPLVDPDGEPSAACGIRLNI